MKQRLIQPLTSVYLGQHSDSLVSKAIIETFEKVIGVKTEHSATFFDSSPNERVEVSGVVGIIQDKLEGTFSLNFPAQTLNSMVARFYQKEVSSIERDAVDAAGELTNMVFGLVKEHLNKQGFEIQLCLPVVIVGGHYSVFSPLARNFFRHQFKTEFGNFWSEICLHEQKQDSIQSGQKVKNENGERS